MPQSISQALVVLFMLVSIVTASGCRAPECAQSSDCPGEACIDGNCSSCSFSSDCGANGACSAGKCVERQCEATADCQSGICSDGLCRACAGNSECDAGLICSSGSCIKPECVTTPDCADGKACDNGVCVLCTTDEQCGNPASKACNHGKCIERECTIPSHCMDGKVCDMGLCEPCSATLPCPDQLGCIAGACQPCTMDSDCGTGRECRESLCVILCTQNGDCSQKGALGCRGRHQEKPCGTDGFCGGENSVWPAGAICDACGMAEGGCPSGMCDEDLVCMCDTNDDCPPALACKGGRCRGCTLDSDCRCGHYCEAQECHAACKSDSECPGEARCNTSNGRCAFCLVDTDCPEGEVCYEDGCVGPCSSQLFGGCAPFVTCNDNDRCGGCGSCTKGPTPHAPLPACP